MEPLRVLDDILSDVRAVSRFVGPGATREAAEAVRDGGFADADYRLAPRPDRRG